MPKLLALWALPRSVSTAFERMMRERGDHDVAFEPFSSHYYFSAHRRSRRYDGKVEPRPEHRFGTILDDLLERHRTRPVFIKDMAYHVVERADRTFLCRFTNTFLIRHPRLSLPSLARIWPDFTAEEAGFAALRELFDRAWELIGRAPTVIDGEDLKADPERVVRAWCEAVGLRYDPDALTWEPGRSADWETWSDWVGAVERSGGLPVDGSVQRCDPDRVVIEDPRLERMADACEDDYEHLARHRL
jgi:hypothetical protein